MNLTDENNPIGIFTTDAELRVQVWDAALARMTGISEEAARGKLITEIVPNLEARNLLTRFWRVLEDGTVEMLAPAFHRFLIPCPPPAASEHFAEMRQRVTIAPLTEEESIRGLIVTIEDVTTRLEREIEFTAQLKNSDDAARLEAAKALAEETETLSAETAAPMIAALDDKNWRVRRELSAGLSRRAAPEAIGALLRAMQEKHLDFAVLNSALKVLQATSVRTTEPLIGFLESADADLRMQAALTLGEQKDAQAVAALVGALADENENVRFHAIEALGKLKAREAVPPLLAIVEKRDFFLTFAALEALRRIRDERSAPIVAELLKDENLREAAIETLGALGGEETVAPLVELLNEDDRATTAVSRALTELAARAKYESAIIERARESVSASGKSHLLAALENAKETEAPALVRLAGWFADERLREKLVRLLESESLHEEASRALVRRGASAVGVLLENLAQATPARPAIIRTLGQIRNRSAFEALVGALENGDAASRQAAIEALKLLAHPKTVERLCALLGAADAPVREAALRVVGYFGAKGCEDQIFDCTTDEDERIRRAALEQLAHVADARSLPALIAALKRDRAPRVRESAAKALAQVRSEEATAALREALADEDSWTRYFAARALGALRDAASREKLTELAETDAAEHVRAAAREVLSGLET